MLPLIGQGSWQFSGNKQALEETKKALKIGIENGMTHIDTAEMYGDSELIIADAIKEIPRHNLFIVSKVLP
ncbi:MAG: aldo/keto reductase, partial [Candidatus Obscuribacterales bacterium]|nr:aldo/keto reductase [Candidatus Obscuribacterales bacterium]